MKRLKKIKKVVNGLRKPKIINRVSHLLKVGMVVVTNGNSGGMRPDMIVGVIGEIDQTTRNFYVWQNTHNGKVGRKSPDDYGFSCSWEIYLHNPIAVIHQINRLPKSLTRGGLFIAGYEVKEVSPAGLKVGCQLISWKAIEKVIRIYEKAKKQYKLK